MAQSYKWPSLKKGYLKIILKKIKITLSIPEKEPIDRDRINVLWMKNSYDQPNIAPWFSQPENLRKYDWSIFNDNVFRIRKSHWVIVSTFTDVASRSLADVFGFVPVYHLHWIRS